MEELCFAIAGSLCAFQLASESNKANQLVPSKFKDPNNRNNLNTSWKNPKKPLKTLTTEENS